MKLNGITKTTGIDYTTDAVRTVQADRSQAVTDFETDGFNTETVKSGVLQKVRLSRRYRTLTRKSIPILLQSTDMITIPTELL